MLTKTGNVNVRWIWVLCCFSKNDFIVQYKFGWTCKKSSRPYCSVQFSWFYLQLLQ